jgi:peptide/nickel transport system substrate-binding protein
LHKPFDNPKVRQALFYAFNQEDFLRAVVGDQKFYKTCKSYFPCGRPFSTEMGMEDLLTSDLKKAQALTPTGAGGARDRAQAARGGNAGR